MNTSEFLANVQKYSSGTDKRVNLDNTIGKVYNRYTFLSVVPRFDGMRSLDTNRANCSGFDFCPKVCEVYERPIANFHGLTEFVLEATF